LLALESGQPIALELAKKRGELVDHLSHLLPRDLTPLELLRLENLQRAGETARIRAVAERTAATRNLGALRQGLEATRRLVQVKSPPEARVDYQG
jgi:hypothetical protein